MLELCVVGDQTVNAATLVFELTHRLSKGSTRLANKVALWHAHISEEDFAEVAVGCHVSDATNFDARCFHRHDDFADACVWRAFVIGTTDEVAVVGIGAEACPNLLTVDDPLIAVING